jgi:hypothetical protein
MTVTFGRSSSVLAIRTSGIGRVTWRSTSTSSWNGLAEWDGVTDPKIDIDWGRSGFQVSLQPASIGSVERELVLNQKVYLDRPYYSWKIRLNWPESSGIAFGAAGFTQTLRAEPILSEKQCLSLKERSRLTSR